MKTKEKQETLQIIREIELMAVVAKRLSLEALKRTVKQTELELKGAEAELINALKAGAVVKGKLSATIQLVPGQCRPEWKVFFQDHMARFHSQAYETTEAEARSLTTISSSERLVINGRTA